MKFILFFFLMVNLILAQPVGNLFTIVTKLNATSSATPSQNKAGSLNTDNGFVSDVSTLYSEESFNVSGGGFDPVNLKMFLMTGNSTLTSFDFTTGSIVTIPVTIPFSGTAYFDNVNFSESNATLYGLVRPFDSNNNSLGLFFGKLNTNTGAVTTLSQNSVATGYQLAGTAIDPELMVYYFKTGPKFLGIDLYNGEIFSQPDITYASNDYEFTNFTYNCFDNTIYGIVREMTTLQMPNAPAGVYLQYSRLGKIDPTTGIVTRVSQIILPNLYYSVTAGSTINPATNTFYCSDNSFLYGISVTTGACVINVPLVFQNGDLVHFLSNVDKCLGAAAYRLDPSLSSTLHDLKNDFEIYPNPVSSLLTIRSEKRVDTIEVFDAVGRRIIEENSNNTIDVSNLVSGPYFVKIRSGKNSQTMKFIKN